MSCSAQDSPAVTKDPAQHGSSVQAEQPCPDAFSVDPHIPVRGKVELLSLIQTAKLKL